MPHQVDTQHPMICRQLVDFAKKNGWSGSMFASDQYPDTYLVLVLSPEGDLSGDNHMRGHHTTISIVEAIKKFEKPLVTKMPFRIEDNVVDVYCDRVVVGCTTVSKDKLQQIYDEMKKLGNDEVPF